MKNLIEKIRNQMVLEKMPVHNPIHHPVKNQDGSIIIIALMVLVIMTVIGLMSSSTVVTESSILRNQGIYKQNVNMVDAAMMELLQRFMQIQPDNPNIVEANTSAFAWVSDMDAVWADVTWYAADSSARILDAGNSMDLTIITANRPDIAQNLTDRGEAATGNLRSAFVGWDIVELPGGGSESVGVGSNEPVWRRGRLLAEYVSRTAANTNHGYGMLRMEIGVKRRLIIN